MRVLKSIGSAITASPKSSVLAFASFAAMIVIPVTSKGEIFTKNFNLLELIGFIVAAAFLSGSLAYIFVNSGKAGGVGSAAGAGASMQSESGSGSSLNLSSSSSASGIPVLVSFNVKGSDQGSQAASPVINYGQAMRLGKLSPEEVRAKLFEKTKPIRSYK